MSARIDEQTWKQISTKLTDVGAVKVLREVVNYATERLKSRIDEVKSSKDVIAFFSKGKEFLTINVTRTNLRIYFQPSSGALFSKDEKFAVEKVSIWEGSFQKASSKYRAMTAWVSKEEHLPGIKTLIDRIPTST
jgi:Zn/Cd-binding protein ZinT